MATLKQQTSSLGNLLNQYNGNVPIPPMSAPTQNMTTPIPSTGGADDDSIPTDMFEVQPLFEFNFKAEKKVCVKKAYEQLLQTLNDVMPELYQKTKSVQTRLKQDSELLGNYYYEYAKLEKVQQAGMETIARGETSPRQFEVYTKMTDKLDDLIDKITNFQTAVRKNYIDMWYDIQQKDEAEGQVKLPAAAEPDIPAIESGEDVFIGTDALTKQIEEKRKKALMAKYKEVKSEINN